MWKPFLVTNALACAERYAFAVLRHIRTKAELQPIAHGGDVGVTVVTFLCLGSGMGVRGSVCMPVLLCCFCIAKSSSLSDPPRQELKTEG